MQGQGPPRQQGHDTCRRRQRPPQIVEHLPTADRRKRARAPVSEGRVDTTENPGQQLPVTAGPAVLARSGHVIARRKLLDDLDIGSQAGASECPLEKVVTEKRALRHAAVKRSFKRIQIVDALAGIGAFAEEILVHVGHGRGVRIDAAHAGEDALEQRALAAER